MAIISYKKKRFFSLLEVLIALMLISLALPLLIAPFVYATIDSQENAEAMKIEKASQFCITGFLADLHLGKLTSNLFETKQAFPIPNEWLQPMSSELVLLGTYSLEKLKPKKQEESENQIVELWRVVFSLQQTMKKKPISFQYDFIIIKQGQ